MQALFDKIPLHPDKTRRIPVNKSPKNNVFTMMLTLLPKLQVKGHINQR